MCRTMRITSELLVVLLLVSSCQSMPLDALDPADGTTVSGDEVPKLTPSSLQEEPADSYAFVDVSVVTMEDAEILSHQTVLVVGKRIVAIAPFGEIDLPPETSLINGAGKYLLPGLADMHIHLRKEYYLLLLLLNGVTTVRNMDGKPYHLQWREQIAEGTRLGPTLFTTGPILDEVPYYLPSSRPLATQEGALRIVAEQKQLGYDAIKVYDGLSGSAYHNLMRAAHAYTMPVVGHVPDGLRLLAVLEAGQRSIEHLDGYFNFYEDQMPAMLSTIVAHKVWTVPTLTCFQLLMPSGERPSGLQKEMLATIPAITSEFAYLPADFAEKGYGYAPVSAEKRKLISRFAEVGAPLLLGTDAPVEYAIPGFAVHQELQNLVEAGLTPYEALRSATYNAAVFVEQLDEVGTVTVGKRADLLLVNANPLEDVANTRRISGVMVQGRWLPRWLIADLLRRATDP